MQSSRLYLRGVERLYPCPFGAVNFALCLVFGSGVIVSLFVVLCEICGCLFVLWGC